jgi:hypothetical protein
VIGIVAMLVYVAGAQRRLDRFFPLLPAVSCHML